jgi:hypothetical protein
MTAGGIDATDSDQAGTKAGRAQASFVFNSARRMAV